MFQPVRHVVGERRPLGVGDLAVRERGELGCHGRVVQEEFGGGRARLAAQRGGDGRGGHQRHGAGVLDHQPQPVGWMVEVERQIGGARAQHGEQSGDHLDGARQREGDDLLGPRTPGQQQPGEPVDAGVQLGVGEGVFAEDEGDGVRGAGGLDGEHVGDGGVRQGRAAGLPPGGQRGPFRRQEQVDAGGRGGAVGRCVEGLCQLFQYGREAGEDQRRVLGVEQVGPGGQGHPQPGFRRDDQGEREVRAVHVRHVGDAVPSP